MQYISSLDIKQKFPRSLSLLGSTGSIGVNTLNIARAWREYFTVYALAAGKNIELLAKQANEFRPKVLAIQDQTDLPKLSELLEYPAEILAGSKAYAEIASLSEVDCVLSAQAGAAGLEASLSAVEAGKILCLANKESLVLAGGLIRELCKKTGAIVLPVDSEHNAIFQCLMGNDIQNVRRIILTASGGPFRGKSRQDLEKVTLAEALQHPNWKMGSKITIDSATMLNKGLEVIEAHHLYGIPSNKIDVLVHKESIVHSFVEYQDASILAQLSKPDMRAPIVNCLAYPLRLEANQSGLSFFDFTCDLTFSQVDLSTFECLKFARQALEAGEVYPIVLNAAGETAVEYFIQEKIKFLDIADIIKYALDHYQDKLEKITNFEQIITIDQQVRLQLHSIIGKNKWKY